MMKFARPSTQFYLSAMILGAGTAVSIILFILTTKIIDRDAHNQFGVQVSNAQSAMQARINEFSSALYGVGALFNASDEVTRLQFHRFKTALHLKFKRELVLSYARVISGTDKERFVRSVREDRSVHATGFPTFSIHPDGIRDSYMPVIYLEPFEDNRAFFGKDVFTNPFAMEAVSSSRDTGEIVASLVPIRFTEERDKKRVGDHIGFIMRLPHYRLGASLKTVSERRAAFLGSIGAGTGVPFFMSQVMENVTLSGMTLKLYDIGIKGVKRESIAASSEQLLYDSRHELPNTEIKPDDYRVRKTMEVGGRIWISEFSASKQLMQTGMNPYLPTLTALAGLLITAFLFITFRSLSSSRRLAIESAEMRRIMIANASHELRTPVNALRLMLEASTYGNGERRHLVPQLNSITDHMCHVVETLLLLDPETRLAMSESEQSFDLGNEIRAAVQMTEHLRAEPGVVFAINMSLGCSIVSGRCNAFRQILVNLLSNAFKFTTSGSIILQASTAELQHNQVMCTIRISDTGEGIPAHMHETIFDVFITSGITNGQTGTGLGLPIARKLARELNGTLILVSSERMVGTTFEVTVPFTISSTGPIEKRKVISGPGQSLSTHARRQLTVLLAEDDPFTAETVQIIIKRLGHKVVHVASFTALCDELTHSVFNVAFIDNRLPGGSGLEAVRLYRALPQQIQAHIVLMTADVTPDILAAGREVCDEIVVKPTSAECIRRILGGDFQRVQYKPLAGMNDLVDPSPLDTLANFGVTETDMISIIDVFFKSFDRSLSDINELINAPDSSENLELLRNVVHRVRGSCATVGAKALDKELEELSTCTTPDAFSNQFSKVIDTFERTKFILSAAPSNAQHTRNLDIAC